MSGVISCRRLSQRSDHRPNQMMAQPDRSRSHPIEPAGLSMGAHSHRALHIVDWLIKRLSRLYQPLRVRREEELVTPLCRAVGKQVSFTSFASDLTCSLSHYLSLNLPWRSRSARMSSILSGLSPASLPPSTISLSPSTTPLPALTTIFTPPSYCLSTLSSYQSTGSTAYFELAPTSSFPQCYPSPFPRSLTFSPGVCPGGYVSVTQSLRVVGSSNIETEMQCCPRYVETSSKATDD